MKLSVIIPTYKRIDILMNVLTALENQTLDKKTFEVIVVNDGSPDNTAQGLRKFSRKSKLNLTCLNQSNRGLTKTRNRGIRKAKGEYILMLNDDMVPASNDFLEKHLEIVSENVSSLGFIDWHPDVPLTDIMEFLSPNGPIFAFGLMNQHKNCGWKFFFATNQCIHRKWFEMEIFDEEQPLGNEDIELGYRMEKRGLRILYNPELRTLHHHYYGSFAEYWKSKRKRKPSYVHLITKHPELQRTWMKKALYVLGNRVFLAGYKLTGLRYFRDLWWKCSINKYMNKL